MYDILVGVRIALIIMLAVVCVALVVSIFIQPAQGGGMGALAGQSSDTYYSKHKKQSLEGIMKKITWILGGSAALISILFFVAHLLTENL